MTSSIATRSAAQKVILTGEQINTAARQLAEILNANYRNALFITFANGGLDTCATIARNGLAFKPTVFCFDLCDKQHTSMTGWLLFKMKEITQLDNAPICVIDDILDTGSTVRDFEMTFGLVLPTFFLVNKQTTHRKYTPAVVHAGLTVETDDWVVFAKWEVE